MDVLTKVLAGAQRVYLIEMVKDFKNKLSEQDSWTKGLI
jgi:hypothetical protein